MKSLFIDGQLDLFDMAPAVGRMAVSCFTGATEKAQELKNYMKRLVPDGEFFVDIGGHPLVLRKTRLKRECVPVGHEFYHYMVDDTVYSGIFIGKDD